MLASSCTLQPWPRSPQPWRERSRVSSPSLLGPGSSCSSLCLACPQCDPYLLFGKTEVLVRPQGPAGEACGCMCSPSLNSKTGHSSGGSSAVDRDRLASSLPGPTACSGPLGHTGPSAPRVVQLCPLQSCGLVDVMPWRLRSGASLDGPQQWAERCHPHTQLAACTGHPAPPLQSVLQPSRS